MQIYSVADAILKGNVISKAVLDNGSQRMGKEPGGFASVVELGKVVHVQR